MILGLSHSIVSGRSLTFPLQQWHQKCPLFGVVPSIPLQTAKLNLQYYMQEMETIKVGILPTKIKDMEPVVHNSDATTDSAETINKDSAAKPPRKPFGFLNGKKLIQLSSNWFKLHLTGFRKKESVDKSVILEPRIKASASTETNYMRGDSYNSQRLTPSSTRNILQAPLTISKDKSMGSSSTFTARFGSLETRSSSNMSMRDLRDVLGDRKRVMYSNEISQPSALASIKELRDVRKRREISITFKRALVSSEPNLARKGNNNSHDNKVPKSDKKGHRKWGSVSEKQLHYSIIESQENSAREQFEFIERKRSLTTHVAVTRVFTKTYQRNTATSAAGEIITSEEKVNQYHLYHTIGTGAFGRVVLARDDVSNESFACKIISKKRLLKKLRFLPLSGNERLEIIKAEIAILKKVSHHPNIITLVEVLDSNTDENLYMCNILLISF